MTFTVALARLALALVVVLMAVGMPAPASGQAPYAVRQNGEVRQLEDVRHKIVVSIVPSIGNIAFEMKVNGTNVLRFPYASLQEFRGKPRLSGIPFLGPWANRLDEQAFYANGKKYPFNMELGNVRGERPIHGLLSFASQWKVTDAGADARAAWVTSRLDFAKEQAWMTQFPFAHAIEMTYRLEDGALEVSTTIENQGTEPMPISIGFHPYFQISDATRDAWTVAVGAKTQWLLSPEKIPTGETKPIEQFFPNPQQVTLGEFDLDHVFGDLVRDGTGLAVMTVKGKSQRIDVAFGPNYKAAVIYAPKGPNQDFICFEPMAGITDAMNLAHRGLYKELQTLAPGQKWQESFWVRPTGF
jgi:aldose 1-epimerase